MPYIPKDQRFGLTPTSTTRPASAGELNFQLTKVIQNFLPDRPTYIDFNDAIGALECCKLELYRRLLAQYEDMKIKENGDVY